jgi:hypothetical protein
MVGVIRAGRMVKVAALKELIGTELSL